MLQHQQEDLLAHDVSEGELGAGCTTGLWPRYFVRGTLKNEFSSKNYFLSEAFRPSEESGRGERSAYSQHKALKSGKHPVKSRKSGGGRPNVTERQAAKASFFMTPMFVQIFFEMVVFFFMSACWNLLPGPK